MEKKSTADILLAAALIAGAAYFLFYTETGREWLERLKNTAADQLDKWLADLEDYLEELELAEQHRAVHRDRDDT
jgi:DNA-binding MarR family transcriptional regulator